MAEEKVVKRQTVTQTFRDRATNEDWEKVLEDHKKMSDTDFKAEYGFTFSAVVDDLAAMGLYTKQVRVKKTVSDQIISENGFPLFFVKDVSADIKKISRSVQLDEPIYIRLKKLEDAKGQYTHSAILNQLLDDALSKYGY